EEDREPGHERGAEGGGRRPSPPLSLWERAGVRAAGPPAQGARSSSPHPGPLPEGQGDGCEMTERDARQEVGGGEREQAARGLGRLEVEREDAGQQAERQPEEDDREAELPQVTKREGEAEDEERAGDR